MKKVLAGAMCVLLGGALIATGFYLGHRWVPTVPDAPDVGANAASPGKPEPTEPYGPKAFGESPPPPLPPDPNAPGKWERTSAWERAGERHLRIGEHVVPGRFLGVGSVESGWHPVLSANRLFSMAQDPKLTFHLTPLSWPRVPRMRPPGPPPDDLLPPIEPPGLESPPAAVAAPWDNCGYPYVTGNAVYAIEGTALKKFDKNVYPVWTANLPVPKGADGGSGVLAADDARVVVTTRHEKKAFVTVANVQTGAPRTFEYPSTSGEYSWSADLAHERFYDFGEDTIRCRSLKDGAQVWEVKCEKNRSFRPVPAAGGLLVCTSAQALWYTPDGRIGATFGGVRIGLHVATADGIVYAIDWGNSGTITATELSTRRVLWHTEISMPFGGRLQRVAVDAKAVYVYGERGANTTLFRLHRETGVVCWRADLPDANGSWDTWEYPDEYPRFKPHGGGAFFILAPDRETKQSRVYRISGL